MRQISERMGGGRTALLLGAVLVVLTGCGTSAPTQEAVSVQEETDQVRGEALSETAQTITVTFMDQETVLGSVQTEAGSVLDAADYAAYETVEGASFEGWYETPTYLASSHKDPASDSFTEDTTLYGDFHYGEVAEDTRHWYIAGTSETGSLALNNWAAALSEEEKAQFELTPTGNALNEFALTIDLYTGDQFQIIPDWDWSGQKGFGRFTQLNETQMKNAGGLSGSDSTANVEVLIDGSYTITLTTNPANQAQDTLAIVRVGDPVGQ